MKVWDVARMGGSTGRRHALGLFDPRHRLASLAWVPPVSERKKIYGKQRYLYVFNFTPISAYATQVLAGVTITADWWWTDSIFSLPGGPSSTQQAASLILFDAKSGQRFMNMNELDGNLAAPAGATPSSSIAQTAIFGVSPVTKMPYFERRITLLKAGTQLQAQLQFSAAATGGVTDPEQLVLGGYFD